LAIAGASDGICPGLEFHGEGTTEPDPLERFRVGVIDPDGTSRRAIKYTSEPRCFRVTRVVGDTWAEDGPLDEAPLIPDAEEGAPAPGVLMRVGADGVSFDALSWDRVGRQYRARFRRQENENSLWVGFEVCETSEGDVNAHGVVLVGVRPLGLRPLLAGNATRGQGPRVGS
jgi:hypothetical protein